MISNDWVTRNWGCGICIFVRWILQRPGRHGSLEDGGLQTCSEEAEDIYFGLDAFQWFSFAGSDIGVPFQCPQASVRSGPAAQRPLLVPLAHWLAGSGYTHSSSTATTGHWHLLSGIFMTRIRSWQLPWDPSASSLHGSSSKRSSVNLPKITSSP